MTEERRVAALKYIEAQLNDGYLDLGINEQDEIEIVKEAIKMLKTIDEFNSIGCTSFIFIPEQDKPIKVVCDNGHINVAGGENMIRVSQDLSSPTIKASELGALDCSHMSDEEFEELCKELELKYGTN